METNMRMKREQHNRGKNGNKWCSAAETDQAHC